MEQKRNLSGAEKRQGCSTIVAYIGFALWVIIISAADIYMNWVTEQTLFESSTSIPDLRWANHLFFSLLLFVPLLIAFFTIKAPRLKSTVQVWMLAAGFTLATFLVKRLWITYEQEATVMQIIVLMLFLCGLFLVGRKRTTENNGFQKKSALGGLVIIVATAITLPWVLWGSLGSLNDTLLYVFLGIFFAYFTVGVIYPYLFDHTLIVERELKSSDFFLDGFVVAIFFLIVITGIGQNGSQPLLLITMPVSAWVITYFAMTSRETSDKGKWYVGLIAAVVLVMPLIWFDADELSLLISGGPGGTLDWAMRAAWFSFSVMLFIFFINLVNLKLMSRVHLTKKLSWILTGLSIAVLAAVYFTFGQPGLHGEKIFIVMKTQANLSEQAQIENVADRRAAVYEYLVNTAKSSQVEIKQRLDSWHLHYTSYYLVNGLEVDSNPLLTMFLQQRADVDRILESPQLRPLPKEQPLTNPSTAQKPSESAWNLTMIGVDKVHEDLGITGGGIVIGQTDTGVDGHHSQLMDSYRGLSTSNDYNWLDPWNDSPFPTDFGGHGTATLGIITGKDFGIAPGAKWIGCVNLARNLGNPAVYLDCMQFMLAPYPQGGDPFTDGDPSKGAMIVNNSWGCPTVEGCDPATYEGAVKALETAGIFMSVAAGNTGYYGCATIADPLAIYANVFTVGSINKEGNVSSFSSLGPVAIDGSERTKPDLLAPGEDIVSSFPDEQYTQGSGTSFAAPHVTGVVALMWSANPALIGNIPLTREILDETATPYKGTVPECATDTAIPNDVAGYGLVNAYAAVEKALSLK
jgi:subtilisin family serine protease